MRRRAAQSLPNLLPRDGPTALTRHPPGSNTRFSQSSGLGLPVRGISTSRWCRYTRCVSDDTGRTSRIIRLARHLELARGETLAIRDLGVWEYDVLAALRASGGRYELPPGELITQTQVSSGTMTNRIDRLDRRGYVTREPDPADRRGVLVRLTVSGRKKIDAVAAELTKAEAVIWRSVPGRKGEELDGAVRELLASFDR